MTLKVVVERSIRRSGLKPAEWARNVAGIPKSTFRDLMRTGTTSGRTLARLQAAGVLIANRKVIASLDVAA